jgi:hypothetical protein
VGGKVACYTFIENRTNRKRKFAARMKRELAHLMLSVNVRNYYLFYGQYFI